MNIQPNFFPLRDKQVGDRVKVPKLCAYDTGDFYYGVITAIGQYRKLFSKENGIAVKWDEPIPFMGGEILAPETVISDE